MKNTKILEMLNNGQVEELKSLLQDEIFTDGLKSKTGAKTRYAAMKKYFTYIKAPLKEACTKPCVIEFEGQKHTCFCNGYSIALTTETAGQMEHFENADNYLNVQKMFVFDGLEKEIDFIKIIAEAKSKGYKLKRSEVDSNDFNYILHYDGAYYKIGLLDATYSIIDNGEKAKVYHKNGNSTAPIVIKNDIGIAVVLPVKYNDERFNTSGKFIIEVE